MDKPKNLYLVSGPSGCKLHIWATSGDQAKRAYCREYEIKASDYWCGVRSLTARKLKPEEVKAWEEQAATERATYIFIRGMLEISAKAYAERGRT
ncbi:hypothetical protein [Acutalibacter muris]|uniref:hypothetical protein n=1 Tax=Acutalibacter muris TaxID=1796620 RepID=UPI001C3EC096|nr:hypothetical protein [Acutalibacter muris]